MIPQGSMIVNVEFFEAMKHRAASISTCAQLAEFTAEASESLNAIIAGINEQLSKLAPLLALLDLPTSPEDLIKWVADFVTSYLTPYLRPYTVYVAQVAEISAEVTALMAAIQDAAGRIGNCQIEIPALDPINLPPVPTP